jgi:hypothetical protein
LAADDAWHEASNGDGAGGTMTAHHRRVPAASLFAGSLLLLFTACADMEGDESDLAVEAGEEGLDGLDGDSEDDPEGIGTQQQALFGNDCRNADIRIVNDLAYPITVRSIDYYNASEGEWRTEDLSNRVVSSGAMEFWFPNLNGAENDWIYSFNVNYECHGSHDHSHHINTPDTTCISGRVFLLEVP